MKTKDFPNIVSQEPDVDLYMVYTKYPFSEGGGEREHTIIHIRVGTISNHDGKPHWEDYNVNESSFKLFDFEKVRKMLFNNLYKGLE